MSVTAEHPPDAGSRFRRARASALAAGSVAAVGSFAAAIAALAPAACGGCSIDAPARAAVAIAAAIAWGGVAFLVHRRWTDPFTPPPRRLAMAALLLAACHATIFLERPGNACFYCLAALAGGVACAAVLARSCRRYPATPLLGSTLAGLLLGATLAPLMAGPAVAQLPRTGAAGTLAHLDLPPVVSILSPKCPVCVEFEADAVPALERALGDNYRVYWFFEIDDPEAYRLVRERLPDLSDDQIDLQLAVVIEQLRRHDLHHVPVTLVGTDRARPIEFVGPYDAEEILHTARPYLPTSFAP